MRTKDYRRFKQSTKFIRRINNFYDYGWCDKKSYSNFLKEVKEGKSFKWLRTTSNPCNCYICSSYNKYKRLSLVQIKKLITEQLD